MKLPNTLSPTLSQGYLVVNRRGVLHHARLVGQLVYARLMPIGNEHIPEGPMVIPVWDFAEMLQCGAVVYAKPELN